MNAVLFQLGADVLAVRDVDRKHHDAFALLGVDNADQFLDRLADHLVLVELLGQCLGHVVAGGLAHLGQIRLVDAAPCAQGT